MKILSIKLCNFRQFYGKTPEIILASGERNTTIIHGNNGAGKTTLLNTFTWVLYERFTAAFTSPELLINKRAITEAQVGASVECWAEIYFEHQNKRYQVKRKCYAYRDADDTIQYSKTQFLMSVAEADGRWFPPMEQPEDIINQILPESLHQYFFFDGEHIEHIFRSNEKNNIADDTKELLGVKVLDRAIDHLKKIVKILENELETIGSTQTKELLRKQAKLEQERDNLTVEKEHNLQQLLLLESNKKEAAKRLLELGGSEELKQNKESLENQEKFLQNSLLESKKKLRSFISSRGYTVFLNNIIPQFNSLITNLRQRGELPSGIKQQFVQQLLARKRCICGNELTEDKLAYNQVKEWMNKAGIAEVEESAIRLESQVNEIDNQIIDFWSSVDREQQTINQSLTELSRVERALDTIEDKFRHYPNEDIKALQKQLDKTDELIREFHLEQGATQQKIEALEKQIQDITKQLIKHKQKEDKQTLAKRRIAASQESRKRLIEVRSRLEKQFRLSLEQRVQEIFSSISFTPYIPRLKPNYELNLVENTSGVAVQVAASTGENQILSLSFIGGIIDRVREWSQKNTLMGPDSSTFPIVMDSPFGSLDEIYRRQVAKFIPQLANQLIILVTKTQWRGEVAQETANYIGKEYILVYYSPKVDCEQDSIQLNGINYPLVKPSPNQFEYTEIIEVI
ncbi:MAG TPA: ATP-binding protein [Cyanothece sp. UBA12306]|nr:ATP-binding protein [Cyanothece sp. UBA12306]